MYDSVNPSKQPKENLFFIRVMVRNRKKLRIVLLGSIKNQLMSFQNLENSTNQQIVRKQTTDTMKDFLQVVDKRDNTNL